jgi:hypothetical protein
MTFGETLRASRGHSASCGPTGTSECGHSRSRSGFLSRFRLALLLVCVFVFGASSRGDAEPLRHGPEWLPPDHPIHDDLRTLVLEGALPTRVWMLRPRTRMELARLLAESRGDAQSWARFRVERELSAELAELGDSASVAPVRAAAEIPIGEGTIELRPYAWLDGVWEEGEVDWGPSARAGLRGTAHLSSHLSLHENLFIGEVPGGRRFADAIVNHTDILLFLDEVYAGYAGSIVSARLGRMRQAWGSPIDGTLLLDANAPPVDQWEVEVSLGSRARFRTVLGVLQAGAEKNLAAHRLDWSPSSGWSIGFTEGAIFRGTPLQALYVIGLVPYTIVERLHGQDETTSQGAAQIRNNVLYQLDVMRTGSRYAIWSAMLLDDVATETADMPTRLGFVIGGERLLGPAGNLRFDLEAAKVYNHTYSVSYENSDWSHQRKPLGYPLGPDVERVRAGAHWQANPDWGMDGMLHLTRRGEGRIGQPWYPRDDPRAIQNPDTPAHELSGRIEQRWGGGFGVRYEPAANLRIHLETSVDWITDRDHRLKESTPYATLRLRALWHR